MKKLAKKLLKKILSQKQIELCKRAQNTIYSVIKNIGNKLYREIYSGNIIRLATHNLIEDNHDAAMQTLRYRNENIYFRSWKNSYVGEILREIYVDKIYDWFFNGKKDLVVLDIGANIGLFTQYARRFAKRIVAVEPGSEAFGFLALAKKDNEWDNVDIVKTAISDKTAENAEFFLNQKNTTMCSLCSEMSDGSSTKLVSTMSLSDLFKYCGIKHVNFMKLDVERSELDIVKGHGFRDAEPLIDNIEMELHFKNQRDEILDALQSYGFSARNVKTAVEMFIFAK